MLNLNDLKSKKMCLNNRYDLIERIGSGGFSEVWLAYDHRSRIDVVLKVYSSSVAHDEEGEKMFREDFTMVCNLNHTNILKPFTFDIFEGSPYIVMPYCEKGSASKLIGKITESELWDFAGQVAAGLAYLHKHCIIHQDIKPANVLITSDNQYLITDFGISTKLRNTIRKSKKGNDNAGSGTTAYMSHECFGANPVNVIARDIWAFGATLYELVTGDVPFGEYGGITQKAGKNKIPKIDNDFSDDIKDIIYKCLAFDAWDRPGADEIVRMIDDHKNGVRRSAPKPRYRIMASVSAVVLIIFSFVLAFFNSKGEEFAVAVNPNDSILIAKIEDACNMVRIEKEKGFVDSLDEQKLRAAAQKYNEAIKLEATDSIVKKGKAMWTASQKIIDDMYTYLYNKGIEYSEAEAENAAKDFGRRSLVLKEYVSEKTLSTVNNGVTSPKKSSMPSKSKEADAPSKTNAKKIYDNRPVVRSQEDINPTRVEEGDVKITIY